MKSSKKFENEPAVSIYETDNIKDNSSLRSEIVEYARQFIGNPYTYGGTSLTMGTDCSGFTQSVFKSKGIALPRTAREQAEGGKEFPLNKIRPGDLIFYEKSGKINHVALYIGNKEVIHASNPESGIKISRYDYRKPCKAVSYLG